MPKVSEFYGIAVYMYFRDHQPPHFHALYTGHETLVGIENLTVLRGRLPARAMGLVMEWASLHQEDLLRVWEQARSHRPLEWIEPLA